MSDISEFMQSYEETLQREIAGADMPPELTERFTFDSCVKQHEGREVYFVTRKSDGLRAVLRVSDMASLDNTSEGGATEVSATEAAGAGADAGYIAMGGEAAGAATGAGASAATGANVDATGDATADAGSAAAKSASVIGYTAESAAAESAILARLDHPAIPKTLGIWEYNGRSYLAREYFDGDDLSVYIRKHGALSRDMLVNVTLQLCDILEYIHSRNPAIIHRDIKPENIILSGNNCVKLIDFGIARGFREKAEKDTQVAGTRLYMSPEQFGAEQTDIRADLYSLGVVMIYMATGATNKQNVKTAFPYKELTPIIMRCIKKDREQRIRTATHLRKRILWVHRRVTRKILTSVGAAILCAGITAAVSAAYDIANKRGYGAGYDNGFSEGASSIYDTAFKDGFKQGRDQGYSEGASSTYDVAFGDGYAQGLEDGFDNGVASIMDNPTERSLPFTQDELDEPISFESWYLEAAVRNALNRDFESQLYRRDMSSHLGDIRIYGTFIVHPSLDTILIKTHLGKDEVAYSTSDGFIIDARGDISTLKEIPNAYYLRNLTLTSQNISDLSPLSGMKLEKINVSDNFVGNLLPLKDMVTLRELDVCQNPLRDLTPISRLLSLEHLDISHTQVTDLSPLIELTKLQTLYLNYCDISDISVLANLPNLREVDLSNTLVTDLSPLARSDNPITVRCDGLADQTVDAGRKASNLIIVAD